MLTQIVDIREVGAPVANANNTDSNSDIIDMMGYDGVVFICPVTDSVQGGVATLKAEQDDANADGGMAALTGASATATSAGNDDLNDKLLVVDVYRPTKRYVQAVRTSATQNIAFGNVIAILYKGKALPPSEHASILDLVAVASPAE
ncbi:MAG: hypothetical protein CVU44_11305 [Chloroflexi bacterium HGW-Chloroflexi-6]|nr:MAG: hypothetical protein CVU44_11305 [Chloroflexi bacterium HGW-Chloroflexi-6]